MARHKRPWCRSCNKRKARGYYAKEGFCSQRCAVTLAMVDWEAMREGTGGDDWCLRCGLWSTENPQQWTGTVSPIPDYMSSDPNLCQCPVPIPSETGEPYTEEEYESARMSTPRGEA